MTDKERQRRMDEHYRQVKQRKDEQAAEEWKNKQKLYDDMRRTGGGCPALMAVLAVGAVSVVWGVLRLLP